MKAWIRQPNGIYKVEGQITTRQVRLEILRPGRKPGFSLHDRARIETVILDAIATGHALADAYRLHAVETAPLDDAGRERLRDLHAKERSNRWREPAATRSEAARRAWETSRARAK